MFCNKCGTQNPDQAVNCQKCGAPLNNPYSTPGAANSGQAGPIPNYLVQSILVTICCCLPFGIPAIVYAAQVNSKVAAGDYAGAQASSDAAKKWSWIAFGLGLVVQVAYVALMAAGGMANNMQQVR